MAQFLEFITTGFRGSGAPIMFLIIVLLFAGLGLIIERVNYLYFKCGSGAGFLANIRKYINGGEIDKAVKYALSVRSPLAKVVAVILQNRAKGFKVVQRLVDEVFLEEAPKVSKFLPFLQVFANMSVLVGLAGTIYGFMEAFNALANVPAAQRAQALAASIAVVMSSTLWGLMVAIVNLLGHAILASKSDKILEEMDEKATKLINQIEGVSA
jgi:biopolymer transport protein ExbB/TolQ